VALLGESEVTDGVDGQEQETRESRKIANAPKRSDPLIVVIVTMGEPFNKLADGQNARASIRENLPRGL
jgi:hypothetical protein